MAFKQTTGPEDRKASSLTGIPQTHARTTVTADEGRAARDARRDPRRRARLRALIVDIILLVILIGLIVGGYFGYYGLRKLYAPEWVKRDVVFCVMIEDVDVNYITYNQGDSTMIGQEIWSSDRTDADCLGHVVSVTTNNKQEYAGGDITYTLYVTVEAEADYLVGHGYRMGATMLLAGEESVFRLYGLSAEGTIISLYEKNDPRAEAVTKYMQPDPVIPSVPDGAE